MSAAPFVPRRAYAWARRRILDSFAAGRSVESRRAFDDREELRLVVEARHCLVTLWTFTADLALDTAVPILPPGLAARGVGLGPPAPGGALVRRGSADR